MTGRTTFCIPIDVARQFDSTVSTDIIGSDNFQNSPDDEDLLASYIEDAETEFNDATDSAMKIGRVGVEGQRNTYEHLTYKLGGHNAFKRNFTGVWADYDPTEETIQLLNNRVIPFDKSEGDQIYVYRGLSGDTAADSWEDITDKKGDLWDILDNRLGTFVFHPLELYRAIVEQRPGIASTTPTQLSRVRFAISYRYGGLGGSRSTTARTELDADITDSQTGSVDVADGSVFPTSGGSGAIPVLVGREYLLVDPSPSTDSMDVLERGVRGSAAASHDSGDRIQYTPPSVRKAVSARAAMQLVQSGRYSEWLPDAEDTLDKSDVLSELESTYQSTVDSLS